MPYRDATLRDSTRRKQDARQVEAFSENRYPVATAKTMTNSLSLASQGATSSSPSSASTSVLLAEVPEEKNIHFGSFHELDPASNYFKKSDTDALIDLNQEVVDAEFRRPSKPGGVSRKDEAKLKSIGRLDPPYGGERSESKFSKKSRNECPEKLKVVIKKYDISSALVARQVMANFKKTKEGSIVDARIREEVKKSPTAKNEKIDTMIGNSSFFRFFTLVHSIATNRSLKANFPDPKWREQHRFPKLTNETVDYDWWYQNFDPEIVTKRLKIMKEAASTAYPDLKYCELCEVNSETNAAVHPRADLEVITKMSEQNALVFGVEDLESTLIHCAKVVAGAGS